MSLRLILAIAFIHASNAIKCHTCADSEFINYAKYVPEVGEDAIRKLPKCDQSEVFNCHFGCMEFKITDRAKQPLFRDCATADMAAKIRNNATTEMMPKIKDLVMVNSYVCVADFCNDDYKPTTSPTPEPESNLNLALYIAIIIFLIFTLITIPLICIRQNGPIWRVINHAGEPLPSECPD